MYCTINHEGRYSALFFHSVLLINLHSHGWSITTFSQAINLHYYYCCQSIYNCSKAIDPKFIFRMGILQKWNGQRQLQVLFWEYHGKTWLLHSCGVPIDLLMLTVDQFTFSWKVGQCSIVGVCKRVFYQIIIHMWSPTSTLILIKFYCKSFQTQRSYRRKLNKKTSFMWNITFFGNWDKGDNMYQTHAAFAFYTRFFSSEIRFYLKQFELAWHNFKWS